MPQDSDIRASVKGFSPRLRARIFQVWMTKPTTDEESAYCRTRGRLTPCSRCQSMESVCIACSIGCFNCSASEAVCSRIIDEKYHRIQRFIAMDVASIPALVQVCLDLHRQTLTPVAMKEQIEFKVYHILLLYLWLTPSTLCIAGIYQQLTRGNEHTSLP
ncbi:hypothetical protein F5146DRAFT_725163 [Armillaria mellea]|nr:hypothetical protein F5146DRAFT_725163 [Armillaria mellea]